LSDFGPNMGRLRRSVLGDDLRNARRDLAGVNLVDVGSQHRLLARRLRELQARVVAHIDPRASRKTDPQRVRGKLMRVEGHSHRYTLYDFDPIARRILCRQQRKRRTGAQAEAGNRALVLHLSAVQIRHDPHRLAYPHVTELYFLEVGFHPQSLERHDGQQGIAG